MNGHPSNLRTYSEIPPLSSVAFGEVISIALSSDTSSLTHGLHRYPAKYIPQIPRWAIEQFSEPGDKVLDPFAGSGTTIVEAVVARRNGIGIDLDPLACLIGQAKTAEYDSSRLRELAATLLRRAKPSKLVHPAPMSGVKNFNHWFSGDALAVLQGLFEEIHCLQFSPEERRFFLVVFSSILRAVSNADDQAQKTYVSGTLPKTPPPVMETFRRKLDKALESADALAAVQPRGSSSIYCGSATSLPIGDAAIDLMVSSPPYLDSVDYMYNLMLEYFWLGPHLGISTRSQFNAARKVTIGAKSTSTQAVLPASLGDLIQLEGVPAYRRAVVAPYFTEMAKHFVEASRVLKEGGRYVIVIGNSRTQNGILPLHDALVQLAASAGFQMEHAFGYRIRRHHMKFPRKGRGGIILIDWIITLKKVRGVIPNPRRLPLIDTQLGPDAVAN